MDIPSSWSDETLVQFYSPPYDALVGDIASSGKQLPPAQTRGVVSVTRVKMNGGFAEHLATRERDFRVQFPTFEVVARGPISHPTGEVQAWEVAYPLTPDLPIRQLQMFFPSTDGKRVTVVTFMAHAQHFKVHRARFDELFTSFRPV